MTVYVVTCESAFSGSMYIEGVFATEEQAIELMAEKAKTYNGEYFLDYEEYEVIE